jgi:hypothetical protein
MMECVFSFNILMHVCVRTVHRDRREIENLKYAKIDLEQVVEKYENLKGLGLQKDFVIR